MSNQAAVTSTINIVPVQGIFEPAPTFDLITLIGPAGTPFYAQINPNQSGLHITNSTIDSTTIGATTPSTAAFTSGTVAAAPTGATDLVNKQYVDYYAAGLSWKAPVTAASLANITSLSGLQTIDGVALAAGETVLVKNQSTAADNGIYVVSSGAWTRSIGADVWDEFIGAITFVVEGSQGGSAWYCTAQPGGTLGVTALNWENFTVSAIYTAGTGLTLSGTQFSITPVGAAGTYGSASSVPVFVTNASGQVTGVTNTAISIINTQVSGLGTMSTQNANAVAITGGTINGTEIGGTAAAAITGTIVTANTYFSGPGTGLTGTASGLSIGGNAATATTATTATSATSATTATNLAGGAAGSLPYQSGAGITAMLGIGTAGQVLRVSAGLPAWGDDFTGTVTSVAQSFTGGLISVSGSPITTSGTLALTVAGTSGGIPYFSSASTWASSGALTQFGVVYGGGAAGAPVATAAGTTGQILIGNTGAAPSWAALSSSAVTSISFGTTGLTPSTATQGAVSVAGTLVVGNGGTGVSTLSGLAFGNGTSAFTAATAAQIVSAIGATAVTNATNATNATNTGITDDTTTATAVYPTWVTTTTGNLPQKTSSTKFSFIPSTGYLTVTGISSPTIVTPTFSGAIAGTYTLGGTPTITNPTVTNYVESVVAIGTVTTSNTLALTNGTVQTATLTASTACTFTMPTATAGKSFVLLLKQAASTGNGTATFTNVKWGTAGAPTITATAGKMDILTFIADGTNWYGSAAQGYTP
jgi:hypothetical protein